MEPKNHVDGRAGAGYTRPSSSIGQPGNSLFSGDHLAASLVAIGFGLFLWNRRTLAGWIIGGIGIIFFVVNFVIFFFPGFEDWTFLVGPIILIIIGVLLLYRSYHDSRHPRE